MADDPAWLYYGRLAPPEATPFNIHEEPVGDGLWMYLFKDSAVLRAGPGLPESRKPLRPGEWVRVIVGAYALISNIAIDWDVHGYVELGDPYFEYVTTGAVVHQASGPEPKPDTSPNVEMCRAARIAGAILDIPGYRLALLDLLSAMTDNTDTAFVFAYRVVEDLSRAVSATGQKDWLALHAHLGVDGEAFRDRIDHLRKARDAAVHGDEEDAAPASARVAYKPLVDQARNLVADALVADPRVPLSPNDWNAGPRPS